LGIQSRRDRRNNSNPFSKIIGKKNVRSCIGFIESDLWILPKKVQPNHEEPEEPHEKVLLVQRRRQDAPHYSTSGKRADSPRVRDSKLEVLPLVEPPDSPMGSAVQKTRLIVLANSLN
jgi:hypothetical protein